MNISDEITMPSEISSQTHKNEREELRLECIAASEHFKQTGLHLTHEEVKAWLRRLEVGEYVEPPACHT